MKTKDLIAKVIINCSGGLITAGIIYLKYFLDMKKQENKRALIDYKQKVDLDTFKQRMELKRQSEKEEEPETKPSYTRPVEENPNVILSRALTIEKDTFWTENILHNNGVNWLTSRSGQGKSILAAQLGIEAATGEASRLTPNCSGKVFDPVQVIWYDVELDDDDISRRYFQYDFRFPENFTRVEDCYFDDERCLLEDIKSRVNDKGCNCAIIVDNLTSIVPTIQPNKMKDFHLGLKRIQKEAAQSGFAVTFLVVVHTKSGEVWEPITENSFAGSVQVARCATSLTAIEPTRNADDIKIIKNIKDRKNAKGPKVSLVKLVEKPYLHFEYIGDADELEVLAVKPKAVKPVAVRRPNKKTKISEEDVKHIVDMKSKGVPVKEIAGKYGVSEKTIYAKLKTSRS